MLCFERFAVVSLRYDALRLRAHKRGSAIERRCATAAIRRARVFAAMP